MPTRFTALAGVALVAITGLAIAAQPAGASPSPHRTTAIVAKHFDLAAGQRPENELVEPNGDLIVSMSQAAQIERLTPSGRSRVIAQLPYPADGGSHVPVVGFALSTGLARGADGVIYVGYAAGNAGLNGIWRINPGRQPRRIVALPADSFPNGMALDPRTNQLYIADSIRGVIWRAPATGGPATVWSDSPALAKTGLYGLGVNGLKLHRNAVWVTNFDQGLFLKIPLTASGHAGPIHTEATVAGGPDDFIFPSQREDDAIIALDPGNQVVRIAEDGSRTTLLTSANGLQNPTSMALDHGRLYVFSAAFVSGVDPNLIIVRLPSCHE